MKIYESEVEETIALIIAKFLCDEHYPTVSL